MAFRKRYTKRAKTSRKTKGFRRKRVIRRKSYKRRHTRPRRMRRGTISGRGGYRVNGNSLMKGTDPPALYNGGASNIIRHREYICDIVTGSLGGTTASLFNIQKFPLNPGLVGTF